MDQELSYNFTKLSGTNKDDCWVLGHRATAERKGLGSEARDSWIVRCEGGVMQAHIGRSEWLTSIWVSANGKVFATDSQGHVYRGPTPLGQHWPEDRLDSALVGVFGLDDEHVYAWGRARGGRSSFHRWDGRCWGDLPSPDGAIVSLHGPRPDLLVAVGEGGMIARWDGHAWTQMDSPTRKVLSCVHVVDDDEAYASGHSGEVLVASAQGWTRALFCPNPAPSIAKWRDQVWIGTYGDLGLCTLDGNSLVSVKPTLQVSWLEPHDVLLFATPLWVGHMADESSAQFYMIAGFEDSIRHKPPLWGS